MQNDVINNLIAKNKQLEDDLCSLQSRYDNCVNDLKNQEKLIDDLELANRNASDAAKKLNKMLIDNRKIYENEKGLILKGHQLEVKAWKRDLGKANSRHIKLEKKVNRLESAKYKTGSLSGQECISEQKPSRSQPRNFELQKNLSESSGQWCSICASLIVTAQQQPQPQQQNNHNCSWVETK